MKLRSALPLLALALVVPAACRSSVGGGGAAPTTAAAPTTVAAADATTSSTEPPDAEPTTVATSAASTAAPATTVPACAATPGTIPDGTWTGPIVLDIEATNSRATGAVLSLGDGSLDVVVSGGQVTGGKWAMTAGSTGALTITGSKATITGNLTLKDGVPSGSASAVSLQGSADISGSLTIDTPQGAHIERPLNGTYTGDTTLTITRVTCDEVQASFVPAWKAKADALAGGEKSFDGVFRWTAHRA